MEAKKGKLFWFRHLHQTPIGKPPFSKTTRIQSIKKRAQAAVKGHTGG